MAVVGTGERSKSSEAQFDATNSPVIAIGQILCLVVRGKLFAYQSGVLIVGYSYGYFTAGELVRIGFGSRSWNSLYSP